MRERAEQVLQLGVDGGGVMPVVLQKTMHSCLRLNVRVWALPQPNDTVLGYYADDDLGLIPSPSLSLHSFPVTPPLSCQK